MKKLLPFLPVCSLLLALLALCLQTSASVTSQVRHWCSQIQAVDALAQAARWDEAEAALAISYESWSHARTYLHIVTQHDAVDDAEAMYRRSMAFAAVRDLPEFRAEAADLQDQLFLMARREQCTWINIL